MKQALLPVRGPWTWQGALSLVNQLHGEAVIKNFKAEQSIHLIDKDKSVLSQIRVRMTGERGQSLEPEEAWLWSTV